MSDLGEVAALLARTNELLTVLAKSQLRATLDHELGDPKRKRLYEMTGKKLSVKQISAKVGMSTGTISGTWKRWEQMGFLVKEKGQYRRIFD